MKRASQKERPPPLKIQKPDPPHPHHHDNLIRASMANHNHHNNNRRVSGLSVIAHHPPQQQYRQPAIYQTRSPDVINTDPHDFMAMVQKLTGQARSHAILSPLAKRPCLPSRTTNGVTANYPSHDHASAENRAQTEPTGLHGPNSYNLISQVQSMQRNEELGLAGLNVSSSSSSSAERSQGKKLNLGLGSQQKDHLSWSQAVGTLLSPSNFVLSPSLLPSPSTFLKDFPFLKSPFSSSSSANTDAGLLPSPKLSMETERLYDSLRTPKLEFPYEFDPKLEDPLVSSPRLGLLRSDSNVAMEAAQGGDHHQEHKKQHQSLQRSPSPSSFTFLNYSPGPLTKYLADLPVLSPAAYRWIENNPSAADAILSPVPQSSRIYSHSHGLPPRPLPHSRPDP